MERNDTPQDLRPAAELVPRVNQLHLEACPFCAGEAFLSKRQDESLWSHEIVWWAQVSCRECDAQGGWVCEDPQGEQAIEAWNKRAVLPARKNTPIEALIAQYEAEECRFDDSASMALDAFRYVETLPDSHVRCLLYRMAQRLYGAELDVSSNETSALPRGVAEIHVPENVLQAVARMSTPLDETRLSGVTAKEDARCMQLIADFIHGLPK